MALADHTYSFRAPADLADRLRAAEQTYAELSADAALAADITRELEIALQRRLRGATGRGAGPGRILRAISEAFVAATEAASQDRELAAELREFDSADRSGAAERAALLRRSAAYPDA